MDGRMPEFVGTSGAETLFTLLALVRLRAQMSLK